MNNLKTVASEIGNLWSSYMAESMSVCELKQYVAKTSDAEIRSILQRALDVSSQRVQTMEKIFNLIQHPIPISYGEKDVDTNAKALYNESFRLAYTRVMHKVVLLNYSHALSTARRPDFRSYFMECLDTSQEIFQKTTDMLVEKGILFHSLYIEVPDRVDIIASKKYLGSIIGENRPINAVEVDYLFSIMEIKMFVMFVDVAYSQVVRSESIRNFIIKAIKIADKQVKKLESILEHENLPKPSMIEYVVTDSKEAPFSDKLMLSHITVMSSVILAEYGLALTKTLRMDLISTYRDFSTELLALAKDGVDLMIENGWLEGIPEVINRRELLH